MMAVVFAVLKESGGVNRGDGGERRWRTRTVMLDEVGDAVDKDDGVVRGVPVIVGR